MLAFLEQINSFFSPAMTVLLLIAGSFFSIGTRFFQFRRFGRVWQETIGSLFHPKRDQTAKSGITPFQAVSTALAGTLGTGNIVGVATAIVSGGPGAIFWMVVSAFFGMITKYAEVLLAVAYQKKDKKGQLWGGPMYYIRDGLQMPHLAGAFAVICVLASFGVGNMVQANSISDAVSSAFGISKPLVGGMIAVVVAIAAFGGVKAIAKTCEKLVPFMAIFYLGACLVVIGVHFERLPEAISTIFSSAFGFRAAGGGFLGYAMLNAIRFGVSRGIFTNEAGLGSAPIAHGSAQAESSVKQGMWGIFEVFLDTVVTCTLTALVILTSGVWESGLDGAGLTAAAFSSVLGKAAGGFLAISILFFALSSILGWYYYGCCCLTYLSAGKSILLCYQICYCLAAVVGASVQLQIVWAVSDTLNLLMFLPNMLAVLLLSKTVFQKTREDEEEKKKATRLSRGSEKTKKSQNLAGAGNSDRSHLQVSTHS